jgi:hypothetical protein
MRRRLDLPESVASDRAAEGFAVRAAPRDHQKNKFNLSSRNARAARSMARAIYCDNGVR